jgi:glycosyltransferase involved in cell wall biosynthesis
MPVLLQLNECLNLSTGRIAQEIGNTALDNGWESYIAYSSREKKIFSRSKLIRVGSLIDPYLHYFEQFVFDREGLASRIATIGLIKRIQKINPDVINIHNIHDHWINYKILFTFLKKTNIKVVWTFHDCWAFTGHCFHFVTRDCEKWTSGCFNCPLKVEAPKTLIDNSRRNYAIKKGLLEDYENMTIVTCSDWMASLIGKSFLKYHRVEVIKNGIDLKLFNYTRKKPSKATFNILAVANIWSKEKGLYDIFKLREYLPSSYKIVVVGLSNNQLKEIPDGITGLKRTSSVQELVSLYSSAHCFINPTYADTFPTVNIEALACGTPVITYRTGGSPEIIDNNSGYVVETGDVLSMSKAIIQLSQSTIDSNYCRKRAELLFDKRMCYRQYFSLYEELITEQK